jgi:hypothetical protein
MFIIVPFLVLCLICASYVITTKFITSNNNSTPAEESVSTTTKQEEVSTAPEYNTGTPVNSTEETWRCRNYWRCVNDSRYH